MSVGLAALPTSLDTKRLCTLAKSLLTTALELLSVPSRSTLKNTAAVPAAVCWKLLTETVSWLAFRQYATAPTNAAVKNACCAAKTPNGMSSAIASPWSVLSHAPTAAAPVSVASAD